MFVLIVGGGKVGLNTARQLMLLGHEIALVEQRKSRFDLIQPELEDSLVFGDGTEIWVLEKAGIGRADMVVAVTGDDEDNIIINQVAKLKFGVPKVVARVNNPFNQPTFDLLGVDSTICAATSMLRLILHELPVHKFVHLLSLKHENVELVELEVSETSPYANMALRDAELPEGVIIAAIVRDGQRHGGERLHRDRARRLRAVPAAARPGEGAHQGLPARRGARRGARKSELDTSEG